MLLSKKSLTKKRTRQNFLINNSMLTKQPIRPKCSKCTLSYAKSNGISKRGFQKWHKYCVACAKAMYNKKFVHLQHKTHMCFECGFIPEDLIQLDVIFKDGNPSNKQLGNILSICSNCNRVRRKRLREALKILDISVDSEIRI